MSKIGYICGNKSWGGLEMNQLRNAIWMKQRGHDVLMICQIDSPIAQHAKEADIPIVVISAHRKYYDFIKGIRLARLIKTHAITHLVVRATYDMSICAFAKSRLGNQLHLSYFMEMQLGVKKTNLLHTIRFSYFDLWSCPLNWLADQVKTMTRFSHERIVVIPSGCEIEKYNQPISKEDARKTLDLPSDQILFGLIGRFDQHKGQMLLLEAMKRTSSNNFSIVFLGEPTRDEGDDYFQKMLHFIQVNNLSNRVIIRPFRMDTETFYKAIDWLVMATKAETFGMVTIEALATGTPVLGSNAGGTPEILKQGELGVLFQSMNSVDLATKMDEISISSKIFPEDLLKREALVYSHHRVAVLVEETLKLHD